MSAFWRQYFHLVWATKHRQPFITPYVESHLYPYMVSKCSELGIYVYAINGVPDHVHLMTAIPPKHGTAKVVGQVKGASAHFLNHTIGLDFHFAWQRGYGSLTVGEQKRSVAIAYVEKQKRHHANQTTNQWLEYCTALDEGPPDKGLADGIDSIFREGAVDYHAWGPLPF